MPSEAATTGSHHHRGDAKNRERQAAQGGERGRNLRGLPAGRTAQTQEGGKAIPPDDQSVRAQSPEHENTGQGSGSGRQLAAVEYVAFFLRFFAAMLGCLFGALSGHGLSSRQLPRGGDQPLGQVEQACEARLNEARPQGQRAG